MRSDNMTAENRLLIAVLKMLQILPCGANLPPDLFQFNSIIYSRNTVQYAYNIYELQYNVEINNHKKILKTQYINKNKK